MPSERPCFHDIMLTLLQDDGILYAISDEDLASHPNAGTLGADLLAGNRMHLDLQTVYAT